MALVFLVVGCGSVLSSAEQAAPSPKAKEMLKARRAEEAKADPAKQPAAPPTTPTAQAIVNGPPAAEANPLLTEAASSAATTASAKKQAEEPAAVLPPVEVRKGRITKLDQELAQQEQAIAREKKNTKISDVDKALNDSKIAKPLAIFGGESSQFRQRVASERVELMEDEKDLIEAIAHAKTKDEKAALQKQLDILRAQRRELDKALR